MIKNTSKNTIAENVALIFDMILLFKKVYAKETIAE